MRLHGSTSIARHAGLAAAARLTIKSSVAVPAKVNGSDGLSPATRNIASGGVATAASATPMVMPVIARIAASRSTRARTARRVAPSAIRTPISNVLWLTDAAMVA